MSEKIRVKIGNNISMELTQEQLNVIMSSAEERGESPDDVYSKLREFSKEVRTKLEEERI